MAIKIAFSDPEFEPPILPLAFPFDVDQSTAAETYSCVQFVGGKTPLSKPSVNWALACHDDNVKIHNSTSNNFFIINCFWSLFSIKLLFVNPNNFKLKTVFGAYKKNNYYQIKTKKKIWKKYKGGKCNKLV